jgi:hypothetical protein
MAVIESGVSKVIASKAAAPVAKGGFFANLGTTTLAVVTSPLFGVVALAGVIGWQLWQAKKDAAALAAAKEQAAIQS